MYIYNVTLNVEQSVHKEWLIWIESHINEVLKTGRFTNARLTEVLVEDEFQARTYSIQFAAQTREDLDNYYKFEAKNLRKESEKKFGDKVLAFRTELKLIREFYPANVSN